MFELADTTWLQFESVKRFAEYYLGHYDEKTHSFIFRKVWSEKEHYLSFEYVQHVHNTHADNNKLVGGSYLQYNKKLKKFVAQKQLVKLVK